MGRTRSLLAASLILAGLGASLLAHAAFSTFTRDGNQVTLGFSEVHGRVIVDPQVISIPDFPADAGTVAAPYTLNPSAGYVRLSCGDADGCDITMGETAATDGTLVTITNPSSNVCNFADTSGVSETASSFAMGQRDALTLIYSSDRWVEVSRSNN